MRFPNLPQIPDPFPKPEDDSTSETKTKLDRDERFFPVSLDFPEQNAKQENRHKP